MKKSEEKFPAIWEKNLENGKRRFMLKVGLIWGVYMFGATVIMNYFLNFYENPMTFLKGIFLFLWWIFGGLLFAYIIWYFQNKKYNKLKKL